MFRNGGLTKVTGVAIALAAVAGCASGGGGSAGGGVAASPEMIAAGQAMFNANCSRCHGQGGMNGRFGPNLTDDTWLWINPSSSSAMADVANIIRTGITTPRMPGSTGMPAIGANYTPEQLNNLAAYVLSL